MTRQVEVFRADESLTRSPRGRRVGRFLLVVGLRCAAEHTPRTHEILPRPLRFLSLSLALSPLVPVYVVVVAWPLFLSLFLSIYLALPASLVPSRAHSLSLSLFLSRFPLPALTLAISVSLSLSRARSPSFFLSASVFLFLFVPFPLSPYIFDSLCPSFTALVRCPFSAGPISTRATTGAGK